MLLTAIIDLLPIVAGGLIGIAGGLANAAYTHRLSNSEARRAELREKLEMALSAAYDLELWLKKEENYFLYNGPENLEHSPIGRIKAVVMLHFPPLVVSALRLSLAVGAYREWMVAGKQAALAAKTATAPAEHRDQLGAVYQPYLAAVTAFAGDARAELERLSVG